MRNFSLFIVLIVGQYLWGQKRIFNLYSYQVDNLYGIRVTKPDGFKVSSHDNYPLTFYTGKGTFWLYALSMVSENGDCQVLYPFFNDWRKNRVYEELKASLGENPLDTGIALDTLCYVKTFFKGKGIASCGVDTLVICRMKLPKGFEYKDKYTTCISVNFHKQGHPIGMMKILLTEEGSREEGNYLHHILENSKHPNKYTLHALGFDCSFALAKTIKPSL